MKVALLDLPPESIFAIIKELDYESITALYSSCKYLKRVLALDFEIISQISNHRIYNDVKLLKMLYSTKGYYRRYVLKVTKYYSLEKYYNFNMTFNCYLLQFESIDMFYQPVMIKCLEKYVYLENALIAAPTLAASEDRDNFRMASYFGHLKIVTLLSQCAVAATDIHDSLLVALKQNQIPVLKFLLTHPMCNPCLENNELFRLACLQNKFKVVSLLLEDERINPADNNHEGLLWACKYGHHETASIILKDKRVDPSQNKALLYMAVKWNRLEIVKLLLDDARIETADIKNDLIEMAAHYSYSEVYSILGGKSCNPKLDQLEASIEKEIPDKQLIDIVQLRYAMVGILLVLVYCAGLSGFL